MPSNLNIPVELRSALEDLELFGEDSLYIGDQTKDQEKKGPSKKERLDSLYLKYAHCQNCGLAKSRQKIVFGMGSLDPKILAVGEGPGYEEDRQGLPFVGKAGMLLDKILASIGLDRNTVYIANIVKCHPLQDSTQPEKRGNDRPPLPEEMEACRPILNQQIEILNPPLILCLGSTAAKNLLGVNDGVTRLRGKIYSFSSPLTQKKIPLIVTYHPAALLRNELLKKDVWQDMKLLRDELKKHVG